jgi:hypothetical protein
MAQYIISDGGDGNEIRLGINANFTELYQYPTNKITAGDSLFYSGQKGLHVGPILTDGNGQANLEMINLGNWGVAPQGTESRNLVPCGLYRIMGNPIITRNLKWNNAQERFEQYDTSAGAYGSSAFEAGGEGANLNHLAPGTHHYQAVVGMLFSARAVGTRGTETASEHTTYVNQSMCPLFLSYHVVSGASGLQYWAAPAADPMLQLHTNVAKGTDNEMFVLHANSSTSTVYGAQYFKKSRGTLASKTVVVADDIGGRIGWKYYDGNSYELTAVIQSVAKGTIADANAGASIQFLTSATNTAGLTKVLEVMDGSQIGFFNVTPVSRQVVPTGSTADQIITALQNLGLFSQS